MSRSLVVGQVIPAWNTTTVFCSIIVGNASVTCQYLGGKRENANLFVLMQQQSPGNTTLPYAHVNS